MAITTEERADVRRQFMLRDSLSFLTLLAITGVLFGITLFLFRSFTGHRDDLAKRWADRGMRDMQDGHPAQAIVALRTALTYAPDSRQDELRLAQALGEAGKTDESYTYFLTLRESEPGSGFINLELARLAARRNDRAKAVEFYRASIYGTWEGDGVVRRAAVRQELASYLISEKEYAPARLELLISAGNSPESADLDLTLAGLLDEAQDPSDAWVYLRKATTMAPHDAHVLETAGRYAYARGDYDEASRLLDRAEDAATSAHTQLSAETQQMRSDAERISQLIPVTGASQREDAAHAIAARTIARKRLDICLANSSLPAAGQVQLAALAARWKGPEGTASVAELRDPDIRGQTMGLVYTTETVSAQACGAPNGDDALLLQAAERMAAADKQVQP